MTFAEVFLRLGSALVAWVVIFAHCVWLAALQQVDCNASGAQPWAVLLGFSGLTLIFACLLPVGATVPGVSRILRLPALALIVLIPLSARHAYTIFERVSLNTSAICSEQAPVWWEQLWGPSQFILLIVIAVMSVVLWRRSSQAEI